MAQSIQAFVTELTRVIRNTDLDDPVKFAAFRQVAEERIQSYCDQEMLKFAGFALGKSETMRYYKDDGQIAWLMETPPFGKPTGKEPTTKDLLQQFKQQQP